MSILLILAALALWGLVAALVELRRDGHRALPTDWSRVAEHDLVACATRATAHR
ncbi:hypothetical protein [Microbacterium sp. YJN-G]|uniref:hypothetical protein n=1 Tax=Microbacterium sp. YJN-G TaxID=2763257 RepID=UPI001877A658|nr:hypothetical protein [Microbacterium sp. YJN-G]